MRFFVLFIIYLSCALGSTVNMSNNNQFDALPLTVKQNISSNKILETSVNTNFPDENYVKSQEENETEDIGPKQNIFLSYLETPTKIFVGQQFSVKVKSIVAIQNFDYIKNRVVSQKNIEILNIDENWTKKSDAVYEKIFYLRTKKNNATFPKIYFELYKKGKLISSQKFPDLPLNIINLHTDKLFSNIVARSLDILKAKTTKFDEQNLMVVLEIVAENANLKDFKLPSINKGGIDSYVDNFPTSKIYYYAIVPSHTDKLSFNYFNTEQNRFIKKTIHLILSDEEISTQSDLNPQDSPFTLYKNITYGVVAVILLLIYFKRKRIIYLILFIILIVLFFMGINPLRNIKIAQNSKVYILPTKNSTIFYVTPRITQAQKLNSRENYIKIILPSGQIGWIKEKNAINN